MFDQIMDIDSVDKLIEGVYEDHELLVINKPAGLVCHPTKTDEYSSLISRVRLYLAQGSHRSADPASRGGDGSSPRFVCGTVSCGDEPSPPMSSNSSCSHPH